MNNQKCAKCKLSFKFYYLKDGVCNGCRNPHLIIRSVTLKNK